MKTVIGICNVKTVLVKNCRLVSYVNFKPTSIHVIEKKKILYPKSTQWKYGSEWMVVMWGSMISGFVAIQLL